MSKNKPKRSDLPSLEKTEYGLGVKRLPRPFGITQMMHQYNRAEPEAKVTILNQVTNFILNQWVLGNGIICGIPYTTSELASFLKIDTQSIQIYMRDKLLESRIWDRENQEKILDGLMGAQLSWILEDRMEIQAQVELLKRSQGGKYMPFISGEVSKALKLKLESNTSLQSFLRNFSAGSINIFNPVQNNTQNNVNNGVTVDEALQLINKALDQKSFQREESVKFIEEVYDIQGLPEVVANNQDVDTTKEGLNLLKRENAQIIDDYKLHLEEKTHDVRRMIMEGLDTEIDEDPEFQEEFDDIE